jgi:manganese transport protein
LKLIIITAGIFFIALLLYITAHPVIIRNGKKITSPIHPATKEKLELDIPRFNRIAIALDFSNNDKKLLSFAIAQGNTHATYILIHVVESVSARLLKQESGDYETQEDQKRLQHYSDNLKQEGYTAITQLGYGRRSGEISRIVNEHKADMLVMGAHGHKGVEDFIHGETVNSVRHKVKIPVLIVNV